MRLMLAGAAASCVKRLHRSGRSALRSGRTRSTIQRRTQPCYGVRLTALRMSSLWSANSAQAITMITMVRMPVTADTAPCMPVVARIAMVGTRPGGAMRGSAGWPSHFNAGTRSTGCSAPTTRTQGRAFVSRGRCWGAVHIARKEDKRDFTADDANALARITGAIADGIRTTLRLDAARVPPAMRLQGSSCSARTTTSN